MGTLGGPWALNGLSLVSLMYASLDFYHACDSTPPQLSNSHLGFFLATHHALTLFRDGRQGVWYWVAPTTRNRTHEYPWTWLVRWNRQLTNSLSAPGVHNERMMDDGWRKQNKTKQMYRPNDWFYFVSHYVDTTALLPADGSTINIILTKCMSFSNVFDSVTLS